MAFHNFTVSDCAAILAACCLFSLVCFFPGYALGWLLDVLQFRARTLRFRLTLSIPLSIALIPILSYFAGRWLSLNAVWAVYGILSAVAIFVAANEFRARRPRMRPPSKQLWLLFAAVFAWVVIATLSLADMQIGQRLYYPVIAFDYAVRSAFTSAIATWGLPAQSPFFFPGHAVALRYHYFWPIPAAMVQRLGAPFLDARQAFIAGSIWCGAGLMCVIALYLRLFSPAGSSGLLRRTFIGIALLGVTGLDILPTLVMVWLARVGAYPLVLPSVEWWNDQVDGWLYTMLWEPHYMAGLIACLMGFLILWNAPRESGRWRWLVACITAGLAFATGVGAGIYIAMVFAVFLIVWTVMTFANRWDRETAGLLVAGSVAFVASLPFLLGLRGPAGGGIPLQFTVRSFYPALFLLAHFGLNQIWRVLLVDLLLLPLNYFLELGFFSAVGWLVWRGFRDQKRVATRQELAAFAMAAVSVVMCTFVRSGVINNNDLGWRGFLIAQFMLLLWATDLLWARFGSNAPLPPNATLVPALTPRVKTILKVLLVVGVASVVYDLAILRFFPVMSDANLVPHIYWMGNDTKLGGRTMANRQAYDWVRAHSPAAAIIQQNPQPVYQDMFYGLYADRRTVAEDAACATVFGGDPSECAPLQKRLAPLFAGGPAASPAALAAACHGLPVSMFIAKDTDRAWQDRASWVWMLTPEFSNAYVRVFACSGHQPPPNASGR